MCDWCQQHGDGKKWYLNVKNFSKEFLKDKAVVEAVNAFLQHTESFSGMRASVTADLLNLKNDDDFSRAVKLTKQALSTYSPHRGQVVPIGDVKKSSS